MNSFYSKQDLKDMGLNCIGKNVLISKFARIYNPDRLFIGNNVRIDDFCILTGEIKLHNFIHISAGCYLYGKNGIEINSYSGMSPKSIIYSAVDDFSGDFLINPMVPDQYTNVTGGKVVLEKYTQLGSATIVLPNVTIAEGVVSGAYTFINKSFEPWQIIGGIPAKKIKNRKKGLLKFIEVIDE